jgi:cellulose synthase/poly-beta-1,6-N-acetylglucosamine synthase-like glycosyltransferase
MINVLFVFAFVIHNIEEAIWLPGWSKHAKKFHKAVNFNEFVFAVLIITILGVLLTFLNSIYNNKIINIIYLGYVGMMVLNVLFPHLVATIALRRYAPGLITAIVLNAPIGIYIIFESMKKIEFINIITSTALISIIIVFALPILFRISKLIKLEE